MPSTAPVRQTSLPAHPFGVAPIGDGAHALVSLTGTGAAAIAIVNTTDSAPRVERTVELPTGTFVVGIAISSNHQLALVTDYRGAAVIDLTRLLHGARSPVVGQLGHDPGSETIEVALSQDDRYAFVSNESDSEIAVYNLARAMQHGFTAAGVEVGDIPIGPYPVGLALAPNGRELYAVNEGKYNNPGSLVVINVARAEKNPATAITHRVAAGCHPGRVVLSANGRIAWVAARGSDTVLSFDTGNMTLRSVTRVGSAPVGLLLVDHDRTLLVANSNRFSPTHAAGSVSVVSTAKPSLTATISAKSFPREFGYLPGRHEVLLTNYTSDTLESFATP
jgi:DNA-binding beta-propeller fold protein YncE